MPALKASTHYINSCFSDIKFIRCLPNFKMFSKIVCQQACVSFEIMSEKLRFNLRKILTIQKHFINCYIKMLNIEVLGWSMNVCMYSCACACVRGECLYVRMSVYTHTDMYVYVRVCLCVCVRMYVYMHVCVRVCLFVCSCACFPASTFIINSQCHQR